jgi:hypothetical protein
VKPQNARAAGKSVGREASRVACLVLALSAPVFAQDALLKWMDSIAQEQLAKRDQVIAAVRTPDEARKRQQYVRAKVLEMMGGLPDYSGPLNARVTGSLKTDGYTIDKVIFESLPRYFVTANLYRPDAASATRKVPGVLFPLGHWDEGKPGAQMVAANLARKGFMVLTFDPVGQGERQQAFDARFGRSIAGGSTEQHFMSGAQSLLAGESFARYRIWDAKRALDYLVSRPEVDAGRIGCTGCSGGGTLTTYISALDDRIKVAAPTCYLTSFKLLFSGPVGDSEQSLPGFLAAGLDLTDYVESFAPKAWLIGSTKEDFFPIEGARMVAEESKRWFRLYDAEAKSSWVVGPGGHGTPVEVREGIYAWMIQWLKGGDGNAREEPVHLYAPHELWVTQKGQVEGRELYEIIREGLEARRKPGSVPEMKQQLESWVQPGPPAGALFTEKLVTAKGAATGTGIVAVDPPRGFADQAAAKGNTVLVLQTVRAANTRALSGEWITNTRAWLIGRNLPGMRAQAIREAVSRLKEQGVKSVRATAGGVAGVWLLMAAALDPQIEGVWVDRMPHNLRSAFDRPVHQSLHDAVLPGFLLHWDLDDLVAAMQPRKVLRTDPVDWMGNVVPLGSPFAYRALNAENEPWLEQLTAPGR